MKKNLSKLRTKFNHLCKDNNILTGYALADDEPKVAMEDIGESFTGKYTFKHSPIFI